MIFPPFLRHRPSQNLPSGKVRLPCADSQDNYYILRPPVLLKNRYIYQRVIMLPQFFYRYNSLIHNTNTISFFILSCRVQLPKGNNDCPLRSLTQAQNNTRVGIVAHGAAHVAERINKSTRHGFMNTPATGLGRTAIKYAQF